MDETRCIVVGGFIDGTGADVRRNIFLTVKGGIITAIGSVEDIPNGEESAIDDLSHCTIVPALVDCSVSLSRSPSVDKRVREASIQADLAKKMEMLTLHIGYCHAHGVQGVAESDDSSGLVRRYQGHCAQESIIDIRTSGRLCRSMQDCVPGNSDGRDFLKIDYSGNIEDENTGYPLLSHEDLCQILRHRDEKKAVVIANGQQQVNEALEAGCDAIEQGYGMGEENLKKMADKNMLWIPSVLRAKNALDSAAGGDEVGCRFSTRYVAQGKPVPGAEAFWKKMFDGQLAQLRLARALGVTTAIGTGAGSVGILHGESMVEEMKIFIKAGYSLEETIRCASESGAGFFDMEKLGALTVGRQATFLVTRGSVKQLPRKLSYLEDIYVEGSPSGIYQKTPTHKG